MAIWPLPHGPTKTVRAARASSTVDQVTVTAGAVAHTKNTTWDVIVAATTEAATAIQLFVTDVATSGAATDTLLDIGIGPLSSEVPIVENLVVGYRDNLQAGTWTINLPFPVPSGSRVVARSQSVTGLDSLRVGVDLYGGATWAGGPVTPIITTYGANTATSKGTVVTASGTTNAKGAWTDITMSTSRHHSGLMLLASANGRVITSAENWALDLGLWNGTAYDVVWADVPFRFASAESVNYLTTSVCPVHLSLPSGSRLGVRMAASAASVTCDAALYGLG